MIKKETKIGLNLLFCDNQDELKDSKLDDVDLIYLKNKPKNMEGYFYVPLKITYKFDVPKAEDEYLASLSRNKRKKIKKSLRKAKEEGISFVFDFPIKKTNFFEWLAIYNKNIDAKEKSMLFVNENWYEKNKKKKGGIFAKKNGKIIGGIIFKKMNKSVYFDERLSVSFSSSSKEFLSLGINELLNYYLVNFAREEGIKLLIRGMDTNLYGYHLSPGLYLFKKSVGFKVIPYKKKGFYYMKINSFKKFKNEILFFSLGDNGHLIGNIMARRKIENIQEFDGNFLSKLKQYEIKSNNSFKRAD